nr:MAG TPA: hypothetical protein [Caudoviricetes sp.]
MILRKSPVIWQTCRSLIKGRQHCRLGVLSNLDDSSPH